MFKTFNKTFSINILLFLIGSTQLSATDFVTITTPAQSATVSGSPLAINGTSSQAGFTVQLFVNTTFAGSAPTDNSGNWTFSTFVVDDGPITITAKLIDGTYSTYAATSNTCTIQNPESIAITTPSTNEQISVNPAAIVGNTSKQGGLVNIYLDGNLITTATAQNNTWQATYTLNSYGPHTLAANLMVNGSSVASASVDNITFLSPQTTGNIVRVDATFGNDTTGTRNSLPFKTINAGLCAALPGDTVLIAPGTYVTTFTIPTGVSVKGVSQTRVNIQSTVSTATDLVTMGNFTSLEDVTLSLVSNAHVLLRGIVFPGTTATNSSVRLVALNVDNSAAGSSGTSNVYGVHSNGTGAASTASNNFALSRLAVSSAGGGNKRGILVDNANTFNAFVSSIIVTNNGTGSAIGVETNNANATSFLRLCSISGSTADVSQTAGTLSLGLTGLINANANGRGFTSPINSSKICWGIAGNAPNTGNYFLQLGTNTPSANSQSMLTTEPIVVKNLAISSRVAPNSNHTFTVFKNGIPTSLTATLASGTTTVKNTTNSVSFSTNDLLSMRYISTTDASGTAPADVIVTVDIY